MITYPIPDGTELHEIDAQLPIWLYENRKKVDGKLTDFSENLHLVVKSASIKESRDCVLNMLNVLLTQSDYVVVKIAEAQALGEDITVLLEKYATVLSNRRLWRNKFNELESL